MLAPFNFQVDFGGGCHGGFAEATGLDAAAPARHRLPGLAKTERVTLKRGLVTGGRGFRKWYGGSSGKGAERRDIVIRLLDEAKRPVMRWTLVMALPVKLTGPTFDAEGNEVAIESIELECESVRLVRLDD